MATRLNNILRFQAVGAGATATLPHRLNIDDRGVIPGNLAQSNGAFQVENVDATDVTVRNLSSTAADCDIRVTYDHTILRDYGSANVSALSPAPFIATGGPSQALQSVEELRVERQVAVTRTVYARPGGSDADGDGSLANPYATIARAFQDIPRAYDGVQYVLDCTGVTEQVAARYLFPIMVAPGQSRLDVSLAGEFLQWTAPFVLKADPTVVQSINLTGQSADPVTGLKTLTDTTQAWTPNEHVGRMVVGSGFLQIGVIASNTATQLEIAGNAAFTDPVRIVEPSATIELTDVAETLSATLIQAPTEMVISGIAFRHANAASYAASVWLTGGVQQIFNLCSFEGMYAETQVLADACWFRDRGGSTKETYNSGGELRGRFCLFQNQEFRQYGSAGTGNSGPFASIFDDCTPVGHGGNNEPELSFEVNNCDIRNAKTAGVSYLGGGRCSVRDTNINNSGSSAVAASGPGLLQLNNVQGAGNNGYGAAVERGAAIEALGGTAVTGTSGDVNLGGAGVTLWGAAPTNDLGAAVPQGCFLY